MAVAWSDAPEYGDILTLRASIGGNQVEVSISVKKGTTGATVRFKESPDGGATYPPAFFTVGTIPKAIPLRIVETGAHELKITDGTKFIFLSRKGGEAGSWGAA